MQPNEGSRASAPSLSDAPRGQGGGTTAVDPLVTLLLPVLLHKLNNATQLLTGVHALMQIVPEEEGISRHGEDLAHTSRKVDDLGWLLALVASIGGANLMLDRREERGLDLLLGLLADALRRDGMQLHPIESGCRLSPAAQGGWQLPWAVGALLNAAARDAIAQRTGAGGAGGAGGARVPGGELLRLEWGLERRGGEVRISVAGAATVRELAPRLQQRLPEGRLEWWGERAILVLPSIWLPPVIAPLEA